MDLAAVYSREIDGKTLTLAPSGWTYKNTFVLYDRETMSLWYPDKDGLRAIQGHYLNRRLPRLPSEDTRWRWWRTRNPESLILE